MPLQGRPHPPTIAQRFAPAAAGKRHPELPLMHMSTRTTCRWVRAHALSTQRAMYAYVHIRVPHAACLAALLLAHVTVRITTDVRVSPLFCLRGKWFSELVPGRNRVRVLQHKHVFCAKARGKAQGQARKPAPTAAPSTATVCGNDVAPVPTPVPSCSPSDQLILSSQPGISSFCAVT